MKCRKIMMCHISLAMYINDKVSFLDILDKPNLNNGIFNCFLGQSFLGVLFTIRIIFCRVSALMDFVHSSRNILWMDGCFSKIESEIDKK